MSNETECSPAWVVDDFFYETTDVAIPFCKVECAETGGCFVVMGMGFELGKRGGCWVNVVNRGEGERTMACDRRCALMTRPIVDGYLRGWPCVSVVYIGMRTSSSISVECE